MKKYLAAAVAAASAMIASAAAHADATFILRNATGTEILSVYATSVTDTSFGYDLLPGTIPAGGQDVIEPPSGGRCMFDVRIEYTNGAKADIRNVNLCTAIRITVSYRGGRPQHIVE